MKESPELAMAIAAEHLIQVFYTHGSKLEQSEVATDVSKYSLHKFYILKIWYLAHLSDLGFVTNEIVLFPDFIYNFQCIQKY